MSTSCAVRSSSPSSKTAKSPIGPAPTMITSVSRGAAMLYSTVATRMKLETDISICRNSGHGRQRRPCHATSSGPRSPLPFQNQLGKSVELTAQIGVDEEPDALGLGIDLAQRAG